MESFFPLPKMNLAAAVIVVITGIHALGNRKLSKNSRIYFAVAAFVSATAMIYERIYMMLPYEDKLTYVEVLYMILLCTVPSISLLLYKACELRYDWVVRVIVIFMIIHTVLEIVLFHGKYIFRVTPEKGFVYGPLGWIFTEFDVLSAIVMVLAYVRLGERFNYKKIGYLILATVCAVMARIMDYYDATYGAAYLIDALSFVLLYVYYSDLCTETMIEKIESSRRQIVKTLATAIDAKDRYTKGHSYRVARYSVLLATALGWSKDRIDEIELQGLMHDVGKIGMPDNVLNKASRLNDVEYDMIKAHTRLGGEIIEHTNMINGAYEAARHHHERYDGKGYPDGLKGSEIPDTARVIAIADSYDAMNSNRIYRKTMDRAKIREQLENGSGTQFDPDYMKAFIKLFDEGKLDLQLSDEDMHVVPSDNALLIRDLMEAFELKREYVGSWDADYDGADDLYRHLKKYYTKDDFDFEMVIVSISPKDSSDVSEEDWKLAMKTMSAVIENILCPNSVGHQVSEHQIICVLAGPDMENIQESMQNVLIYFYKIFDTALYNIKYDRVKPEDKETE